MVVFGQKEAKATQVRQEQSESDTTTTDASEPREKKKMRLRENGVYGDAPTPTGERSELTRD